MAHEPNEPAATTARSGVVGVIKDAAIAAALMLGLTLYMVGLETVDIPGGLTLEARPGSVATAVAVVFAGRLALGLYRLWRRPGTVSPAQRLAAALGARGDLARKTARVMALLFLGFALLLPFLPFGSRYVVDTGTQILIYVMLGWGLNIVVGLAGLLVLGYAAFYAVGAYSFALLSLYYGLSFWVCLPIAGALAALSGIVLGFPVLRLRGDYLAIVTLGFGEIVRVVLLNWTDFTRGPNGISDVPRPTFFGLPFARRAAEGGQTFHIFFDLDYSSMHRVIFLYYVSLALAIMAHFFIARIRTLPLGRAWEALREDEIACRSLGIDPTSTKLTALAIGAMFGGFAGTLFATRQGFVSPESFTFMESAVILAIVVLGGMGSQMGVALAAILLIGSTELFRSFAEYRMLALGAAMVLIMIWRPQGLISHREPTVRLAAGKEDRAAPAGKEGRP